MNKTAGTKRRTWRRNHVLAVLMAAVLTLMLCPGAQLRADAASTLYWPVPGHHNLSQGLHDGHAIDISDGSITGATVIAAMGGTVTHIFLCGQQHYGSDHDCYGFGTGLVIKGDDGRTYQYAHMQANSIPTGQVYHGAYVSAGQMIGKVGDTGNASGPHLHFGITIGNYWNGTGINPSAQSYYPDGSTGTATASLADFTSVEDAASVTDTSAVVTAHIPYQSISGCGVYIGTGPDSITQKAGSDGAGKVQNMWYTLSGLTPGTTYYYKFYYTVGSRTKWSAVKSFTTTGTKPSANTTAKLADFTSVDNASSVTANSAVVTAHIPYQSISGCGVYYGTSPTNTSQRGGSDGAGKVQNMWYTLSGLTPGTTYYYKFYYTVGSRTKWSAVKSFTTLSGSTVNLRKDESSVTDSKTDSSSSEAARFSDVVPDAYYYSAVNWAVSKGITSGKGNNTFAPNEGCTRAQTVTFLYKLAGSPAVSRGSNPFRDIAAGKYYYDAVQWAYRNGITSGTEEGSFSPNRVCTRAQMVSFLYKMAGSPSVSNASFYEDVESSSWYAKAVNWARQNGITSGTSTYTFSPNRNCTRGQMMVFLQHYAQKA